MSDLDTPDSFESLVLKQLCALLLKCFEFSDSVKIPIRVQMNDKPTNETLKKVNILVELLDKVDEDLKEEFINL